MKMNGIIIGILGGLLGGLVIGIVRGHSSAAKEFEDVLAASNERADRLEKELDIEKDKHRKAVELINAELKDIHLNEANSRKKPPINDLIKKYKVGDYDGDADMDVNDDIFEETEEKLPSGQVCFEITSKEFQNDYAFCDGTTFVYYTEDDVLLDERDEVIDKSDIDLILGEYGMEKIRSTPESEIYFHNDTTDTNYEIIVEHGLSYEKDVLGLDGEEFEY